MIEATPEAIPHRPATLPGDAARQARVGPMIRVNQAGELGAREIYRGQIAVLKDHPCAPVLVEMAEQENEHLAAFDKLIAERGVRPTALSPIWRLAGYALGAGSALLGERAAMATTVAVEDVIEEHYQKQLDALDSLDEGDEAELRQLIAEFRADELKHRDVALENGAEDAPAYQILSRSVKSGTRLAIWLAERV
ncbi:MAG: demethoxyubiquinone hydroxylase family protein [Rhodospirillaceae bacterium]|jgi:ubiquinone biosynthesis monooxygenase Coq7|nr:demethoxyubiquinone hydroxylase family protein [Rhodospirillaceae bacterium]MBT4686818.1 demethoxyubiquinone hydroxylase family protein [Rhodospirillaceae bacterium]MBT5081922.1 demethoxyubiquinone hydroxylase family protein [Rhodospirillaceae bacterium]MBT5523815.1 demethoxyubiquinone hydroxylase family protein [Rhodospirillaceae bacterium]MBT5879541.1 demethoxyubiquinone hydroxylase family protein [Rhodospirillaceae bacterium]